MSAAALAFISSTVPGMRNGGPPANTDSMPSTEARCQKTMCRRTHSAFRLRLVVKPGKVGEAGGDRLFDVCDQLFDVRVSCHGLPVAGP